MRWLASLLVVAALVGCSDDEPTERPAQSPSPLPPVDASDLDGTLVYSSVVADGSAHDIFVLDLHDEHRAPVRLTDGPAKEFDPALSPDGAFIAYRVNPRADSDEADIWVMRVDGTGRRNLTRSPEDSNWAPAWSPDGEWIVFGRDLGERWELRRIRSDGTDDQAVAHEGVFPTWGPDGLLAWSGPGGITIAHPDGSGDVALDHPAEFLSWLEPSP